MIHARLVLLLFSSPLAAAAQPFLETHCIECHDGEVKKGNFDLEALMARPLDADTLPIWLNLHDVVAAGDMPPKKKPQPPTSERAAFLTWLQDGMRRAETSRPAAPAMRRMNRAEYENALRDLLHLPLLRVKDMLPEDAQQSGFDKVGAALDFSHILISKYMQAADHALRLALVKTPQKPETKLWRDAAANQNTARGAIAIHCAAPLKGHALAPGLTTQIVGNPEKNFGNCYRAAQFKGEADSVALLTGVIGAHQPQGLQIDRFKPSVPGWYRVKFSAWSLRWMRTQAEAARRGLVRNFTTHDRPFFQNAGGRWEFTRLAEERPDAGWRENVEFYGEGEVTQVIRASLKGEPIGLFDAPSLKPTVHEFKVWLNPDERVSFHAMTLPAVGPRNSGMNEGVRSYEGPGVAFDWFEVEGPIIEDWPPASHKRLLGTGGQDAKSLLASFATAAFRRPLVAGELAPYETIVTTAQTAGMSFQDAMIEGCKAILCSPDFLLLGLEPGDHGLASRLAFFLWNGPPDAELTALAAQNALSQPATLQAQIRRMLADARSDRFVAHFLDEWLELKKIDFTTPDPNLYPEYDPWLHDSMLAETRGTFRQMLDQDHSVRRLIRSDTVYVNQRLAELYGLRGVTGSQFREVKLPADSPRGGILTQASVLKVTANGTATSPVLRGVWVMERILGLPRPPPPPNVPAIEPDATGAVTVRQMIEKHRADAACAACHAKIDPPGLALENFDVLGGWRDAYRLAGKPKKKRIGKGKEAKMVEEPSIEIISDSARHKNRVQMRLGPAVDASGVLADGRAFKDIQELRQHLLADEDALARNVIRQLLVYATGRSLRFSDRDEIEAILTKTKSSHHGLRSLIQHVILSPLFAQPPQR